MAGRNIRIRADHGLTRARKRILIVNAFFDEYRRTRGSPARVPRAMGPEYLAGAFAAERCDIRLYNEQYSGPLRDLALLARCDMLVLTGVTTAFDRMRQLTAYARALNPGAVVVAGGPPVRALPHLSQRIFDYACTGDVEELQGVIAAVFNESHVAAEIFPRYDLGPRRGLLGYVESSRNCNFRCSFCSLTGEGGRYRPYDLDYLRRQILATGKKKIVFIDNNFYGNDRDFFLARLALLKDLRAAGRIDGWSALVTGDFFARSENLALARAAGCQALFSGVESFDAEVLRRYNKRHNTLVPQVALIRNCLEAGIVFTYGIMLDPSSRSLAELKREIEFIVDTPEITLPAFFTLAIPLLGTPYFKECLERGLLLPDLRLREFDGISLTLSPVDPLDAVLEFVGALPELRGYRGRVLAHTAGFLRRYRRHLSPLQLCAAGVSAALVATQSAASSPLRPRWRRPRLTYYAPTEPLDPLYRPLIRLPAHLEDHFRPTRVTDARGRLAPDLAEDLG